MTEHFLAKPACFSSRHTSTIQGICCRNLVTSDSEQYAIHPQGPHTAKHRKQELPLLLWDTRFLDRICQDAVFNVRGGSFRSGKMKAGVSSAENHQRPNGWELPVLTCAMTLMTLVYPEVSKVRHHGKSFMLKPTVLYGKLSVESKVWSYSMHLDLLPVCRAPVWHCLATVALHQLHSHMQPIPLQFSTVSNCRLLKQGAIAANKGLRGPWGWNVLKTASWSDGPGLKQRFSISVIRWPMMP